MAKSNTPARSAKIATEALETLFTGRQVPTFSSRYADFTLPEAYDVAERIRQARERRGETSIGRKIGFTNRAVWSDFGISGPIWGYLYDSTVRNLPETGEAFSLTGLAEPRIEPELVLHLSTAPQSTMNDHELTGCIDWMAHGFEIVHSIFPRWSFTAADAVAAFGVHGALLLGERHPLSEDGSRGAELRSDFSVELRREGAPVSRGKGRDVLGGPVQALRFLVEELERNPAMPPLRPGETITTGTLTQAMPVSPGETWTTALVGIKLDGLHLELR